MKRSTTLNQVVQLLEDIARCCKSWKDLGFKPGSLSERCEGLHILSVASESHSGAGLARFLSPETHLLTIVHAFRYCAVTPTDVKQFVGTTVRCSNSLVEQSLVAVRLN
jgi:hypothetical protein